MALPQQINFRATAGYRTDDSADAYVQIGLTVNYPTVTPQGNTVGFEQVGADSFQFNESATNDVRLAGARGSSTSGAPGIYRIDLPAAGTYRIRCAAGRATAIRGVNVRIFDDTNLLSEIIPPKSATAVNIFTDATNVDRTAADWPAQNQSVDLVFATSILRIYNSGQVISGRTHAYIAHFSVESVSSGTVINTTPASFSLHTNNAAIVRGTTINTTPASFSLHTNNAAIIRGTTINTAPASFSLHTNNAAVLLGTTINTTPAAFTLHTNNADIVRGTTINTTPAAFTLHMNAAQIIAPIPGTTINTTPAIFTLHTNTAAVIGTQAAGSDGYEYTIYCRRKMRR